MIRKLRKWSDYFAARLAARGSAAERLEATAPRRILVVCYGNIYRSPFVEHSLRAGADGLQIRSAGFHRTEGRRVEPAFQTLARELYGLDLSGHRSRLIREDDVDWCELLVMMDDHNYRFMHDRHRAGLGKCIWLGALCRDTPVLIDDPYGAAPDAQERIAGELHLATQSLLAQLNHRGATT